ncbi:Uncharacterised protein [uncultured archaeon]|nr:Uncharacterised protein [uncultured archaeon]
MRNFAIIALVCAVLLFGCTGQSGTQQGGQQSPSQPGTYVGQPAPSKPPSSVQQPSASSASDQLGALFDMRVALQYKAAYDVSSEAMGQQTSMQILQYVKGESKMRSDTEYAGIQSRTYFVDSIVYVCTNTGTAWTCMKSTAQEEPSTTQANSEIASNLTDYQVVADGTMQVAGVTATCYKITGKDISYYRYCASPEGVPLYMKMEASAQGQPVTTEMKATSYSTSVPDSDFVLPAAATEAPALGNNAGAGAAGGAGAVGAAGADPCSYCSQVPAQYQEQCLASCAG